LTPADIAAVDAEGSQILNKPGFTVGAELGYNWQVGLFVFGFETDIGGLTASSRTVSNGFIKGTATPATSFFPSTLSQRVNDGLYGTVRGRLGVTFDRLLIYATGGSLIRPETMGSLISILSLLPEAAWPRPTNSAM
jgi:hypothetical protein